MRRWILAALAVLIVAQLAAACQTAQPTATALPQPATEPPKPTTAPGPTTPPPATSAQVEAGLESFTQMCASCHGPSEGWGPALNRTTLSKYGTAKALFDKISTTMPKNSPGTLSRPQYYNVIAYLLSSLGIIRADQAVSADTVAGIAIQ